MDYEKKYKEALKRAKNYHEGHTLDVNPQTAMEYVFPELKESEDKIMKELIFNVLLSTTPQLEEILSIYKKRREDVIAWLEKQSEQNPPDNVEPKFKVGDWVVNKETGTIHQIQRVIEMVTNNIYGYDLTDGGYISTSNFNKYRLWTIQDAKDGDVLALNGEVFIYAHRKQLYPIAVAHCFVNSAGDFCFDGEFGYTEREYSIHPATKEQRELLFQKMKEAGYEWDAEKKDLKKLKQESALSEEHMSVVEKDGEKWIRVCALGEDFIIAAHDYTDGDKTEFTWEEACNIGTFSIKQGYIILALLGEINAKLKEIWGEPLDSYYWSSSEYSQYGAWDVNFHSGGVYSNSKCSSFVARAVIAF